MTTTTKDTSRKPTGLDPRDVPVHQKLKPDQEVTIAEVATALGMGRSTVTKALRRLEQAGLAVRAKGGRDGAKRLPDTFTLAPSAEPEKPKTKTDKPASKQNTSGTKPAASGTPANVKGGRLAKGELEAMVRRMLADHPGVEFGPSQLAKELDKSAGAIANILVKMTAGGDATLVQDKPKRYRLADATKTGGKKAGAK